MTFALIVAFTSFLCTLFACRRKKRLFAQESAFVWLGIVPVFTTAFDILTPHNSTFLLLTKDPMLFLTHRVLEFLTLPLLLLLFLETLHTCRSRAAKLLTCLASYAMLYGMERICLKTAVFRYVDWHPWWSLIVWAGVLLYAALLQTGMRRLLVREGVRP